MSCERISLPGGATAIVCGVRRSKPKTGLWPATIAELQAAGYAPTGAEKTCDCGTRILWWTTPAKKWIPLSGLKDSRLVPHHSVCARVKQFRAANKRHADRAAGPKPEQLGMFGEEFPR